jgi:hypothetical protein
MKKLCLLALNIFLAGPAGAGVLPNVDLQQMRQLVQEVPALRYELGRELTYAHEVMSRYPASMGEVCPMLVKARESFPRFAMSTMWVGFQKHGNLADAWAFAEPMLKLANVMMSGSFVPERGHGDMLCHLGRIAESCEKDPANVDPESNLFGAICFREALVEVLELK